MIRRCGPSDFDEILAIVNAAAQKYRGAIPDDCWHEPYMTAAALASEIAAGVRFWGVEEAGALVGVMGLQDVRDVTLIRHAYVRPSSQGSGVGSALMREMTAQAKAPLLVGTWAAAHWAIAFYEKHGFRRATPTEKDRLLDAYWSISPRQKETSVVLRLPRSQDQPASGRSERR